MRRFAYFAPVLVLAFVIWQFPAWNEARRQLSIADQRVAEMIAAGSATIDLRDLRSLRRLPDRIAEAEQLQYLVIRDTNVSDISVLSGLGRLRQIDLGGTPVSDLRPLRGHPQLRLLNLRGTWVADPGPLEGLPKLARLDLSSTQIDSLEPATRLSGLLWIHLHEAYGKDGSQSHYRTLVGQVADVHAGRAFRENYQPDRIWLARVAWERLKARLGLGDDRA